MLVKKKTSEGLGVNIAVVGFGSIARKHIKSILSLKPSSRFFILTSQQPDLSFFPKSVKYFREIGDVFAFKPDFFLISSPANLHGKYIKEIYEQQIPALIEKPLASDFDKALEIVSLAKLCNQRVCVGYNLRFSNALSEIKRVLDRGEIGKLLSVQVVVGQNLETWRCNRAASSTVSASRESGGGVVRELSHELDYMQYLFGAPKICSALMGKQKFINFDVEDTAFIHLSYSAFNTEILVSLNMDFTRCDNLRSCHIIGDMGTLRWDLLEGTITKITLEDEHVLMFNNPQDLASTNIEMWSHWFNEDFSRFANADEAISVMSSVRDIELSNWSSL